MRIRFDAYSSVRFGVNDILIRCAFLGALGVHCCETPIPNYAQMHTLRKVVITENLE